MGLIRRECKAWDHPEHYPTYMPEQEYLGRLLAVVDTDALEPSKFCPTEQRYVSGLRHQVQKLAKEESNAAAAMRIVFNQSVVHTSQNESNLLVTNTAPLMDLVKSRSSSR